jgi:hypothetical protein
MARSFEGMKTETLGTPGVPEEGLHGDKGRDVNRL